MNRFCHCPRCGNRTLEHLKTHSHCIDCQYYENSEEDDELAYFEACSAEAWLAMTEKDEFSEDAKELEDDLAS